MERNDKVWPLFTLLFILFPIGVIAFIWFGANVHELDELFTYSILLIGCAYILLFKIPLKSLVLIGFIIGVLVAAYFIGVWTPATASPEGSYNEFVNNIENGNVNESLNLTVYYFLYNQHQDIYETYRDLMSDYVNNSILKEAEVSYIINSEWDSHPDDAMNETISWVETTFNVEVKDNCYVVLSSSQYYNDIPGKLPYVKVGSTWYLAVEINRLLSFTYPT